MLKSVGKPTKAIFMSFESIPFSKNCGFVFLNPTFRILPLIASWNSRLIDHPVVFVHVFVY